jgi:hypothetical protein
MEAGISEIRTLLWLQWQQCCFLKPTTVAATLKWFHTGFIIGLRFPGSVSVHTTLGHQPPSIPLSKRQWEISQWKTRVRYPPTRCIGQENVTGVGRGKVSVLLYHTAISHYTIRQQDPRTDVSRGKCISRDKVSADKIIFQIISVTVVRPTLTSSRFSGQIYIPTKGNFEKAQTDGFFELLWRTATSFKSIYFVHSTGIVIANAGSDVCIFTNHRRQSAWRF